MRILGLLQLFDCQVHVFRYVNLSMSKEATRRWQSGSCWELELQVGVVIVYAHQTASMGDS